MLGSVSWDDCIGHNAMSIQDGMNSSFRAYHTGSRRPSSLALFIRPHRHYVYRVRMAGYGPGTSEECTMYSVARVQTDKCFLSVESFVWR